MKLTYNPQIFAVGNMAEAMNVILTPEGMTTAERWQAETPYLADLIGRRIAITPDTVLIDYGCGIGRVAKELIARHGCRVIGVDISASMRALAPMYVGSDRFFTCAPEMIDTLIARGFWVDAAISVWVLQHCHKPDEDIARLRRAIKPGGDLFVLNNNQRVVPTREASWVTDELDIKAMLTADFDLLDKGRLPPDVLPEQKSIQTFWAAFRVRP